MTESTPEPVDLGEPEVVPTVVSPYRVTNNILGQPVSQYFEMITENGEEPERILFTFISVRTKEEVGVELWPDGTIHLGSWNAEGEWVEMYLCEQESIPFDLAAWGKAQEASIIPS